MSQYVGVLGERIIADTGRIILDAMQDIRKARGLPPLDEATQNFFLRGYGLGVAAMFWTLDEAGDNAKRRQWIMAEAERCIEAWDVPKPTLGMMPPSTTEQ